jgi:hypothetical protein
MPAKIDVVGALLRALAMTRCHTRGLGPVQAARYGAAEERPFMASRLASGSANAERRHGARACERASLT